MAKEERIHYVSYEKQVLIQVIAPADMQLDDVRKAALTMSEEALDSVVWSVSVGRGMKLSIPDPETYESKPYVLAVSDEGILVRPNKAKWRY